VVVVWTTLEVCTGLMGRVLVGHVPDYERIVLISGEGVAEKLAKSRTCMLRCMQSRNHESTAVLHVFTCPVQLLEPFLSM
jgi:hypothetical protein